MSEINIRKLISDSIQEYLEAAFALQENKILPFVPLPRSRKFLIAGGIYLDFRDVKQGKAYGDLFIPRYRYRGIVNAILEACNYEPKKVLQAAARIKSATLWCKNRLEGLKRASNEILRQQEKAQEVIEAKIVLSELSNIF